MIIFQISSGVALRAMTGNEGVIFSQGVAIGLGYIRH